jgi:hypothetical protein
LVSSEVFGQHVKRSPSSPDGIDIDLQQVPIRKTLVVSQSALSGILRLLSEQLLSGELLLTATSWCEAPPHQ